MSPECRALFDRYVDKIIEDNDAFKPCLNRSHVINENKDFRPKRKYNTKKKAEENYQGLDYEETNKRKFKNILKFYKEFSLLFRDI